MGRGGVIVPFSVSSYTLRSSFGFCLAGIRECGTCRGGSGRVRGVLSRVGTVLNIRSGLASSTSRGDNRARFTGYIRTRVAPTLPTRRGTIRTPRGDGSGAGYTGGGGSRGVASRGSDNGGNETTGNVTVTVTMVTTTLILAVTTTSNTLSGGIRVNNAGFGTGASSMVVCGGIGVARGSVGGVGTLRGLDDISLGNYSLPSNNFTRLTTVGLSSLSLSRYGVSSTRLTGTRSIGPGLMDVSLDGGRVASVSGLATTGRGLGGLGMDNGPVGSCDILTRFGFEDFDTSNTKISSVTFLTTSSSLRRISLGNGSIRSLSSLSTYRGLRDIRISSGGLSSLDNLRRSVGLTCLGTTGGRVSSLGKVRGYAILISISLDAGELNSMSILTGSTSSLAQTCLDGGRVSSVSTLSSYALLRGICLSSGSVDSVSTLTGGPSLGRLSTRDGTVNSVATLGSSGSLRCVGLYKGSVSSVSTLSRLLDATSICVSLDDGGVSTISLTYISCSFLGLRNGPLGSIKGLPSTSIFALVVSCSRGVSFSTFRSGQFGGTCVSRYPLSGRLSMGNSVNRCEIRFISRRRTGRLPTRLTG